MPLHSQTLSSIATLKRLLGRSGREEQGQGEELAEGVMDTEGGSRGVGVMESEEAELVKGTKKVGSEGVSELRPRVCKAQWLGRTM